VQAVFWLNLLLLALLYSNERKEEKFKAENGTQLYAV